MIETVVKIGGAVLAHTTQFDTALDAIAAAARDRRLLIVPGGGPFAEAVRAVDRRLRLSEDAAHWMAILGMDQYGYLIASRLAEGIIVTKPRAIRVALDARQVPVLAPSHWLRKTDPLPHSWEVTSDSIAAWIAGEVAAPRLVVIKPPGVSGIETVDPYFPRALPQHVTPVIVDADDIVALHSALRLSS